ncbi:sigma-70 family RNA polymerase sigma factor [Viridibacillus sp. YIM B01967]|uniref:Sigma-70 family RNA polymerase sigma factor n=1 Tax=Viridibacillus soli TaxID=2798301 RepID=A0ABS1H953_9BACL|nr:sigma-70 family RNA polymerase sigma factor [Viridibacillus soli]MBK3495946.1 sigma-70 family RNA polymerase sigma factor [Viridibacillus soli]
MTIQQQITNWFDQYKNDIYQFLHYRIGTNEAEDCVQEVFIKAYRSYETFQQKSSPKTWLFSIAHHVAIDTLRKKQRHKWKGILLMQQPEKATNITPEHLLQADESMKELIQMVQSLKSPYTNIKKLSLVTLN